MTAMAQRVDTSLIDRLPQVRGRYREQVPLSLHAGEVHGAAGKPWATERRQGVLAHQQNIRVNKKST